MTLLETIYSLESGPAGREAAKLLLPQRVADQDWQGMFGPAHRRIGMSPGLTPPHRQPAMRPARRGKGF